MSVENPTLDDYLRWICCTSIDDGKASIRSLLERPEEREPKIDETTKRQILEGCLAHEIRGSHRKSLINAIKSAIAKLPTAALAPVEVTTDSPVPEIEDPRWLAVRETAGRLRETGRTYLEIQAFLGWQLAQLKKDHGVKRGNNQAGSDKLSDPRTWDDLVHHYTGYTRRTADRLIELFDSAKAKLKRVAKKPEEKNALTIFAQGNPLALPPEQREHVRDVIASLCTGETQGSLMTEFGITPKPVMPAKTPAAKGGDQQQEDQLELAFHHWDGPASAILKARSEQGVKLLHLLPPIADEPGKLSLTFLRDEAAALLTEVEAALAAHAKPAKGTSAA
ncbi:hypothetical protein OKA04_04565 [Luteolibacter flavescens]|uniref:Uncharacterized protein n=1 Tax=Luteolibacter flavescens TaxID=1859460 RepID=A0ABT3FK87_9BACT|nr:hypothetical protein [Luteolibacter flavescens]MCW1883989.1 hypothetical protein [Luteolibacter flavescens]